MPNTNIEQLGESIKPNIPNGEDLKNKAGNAAIMGTIGVIASLLKNSFKPPKKLKPMPLILIFCLVIEINCLFISFRLPKKN